MGRLIEQSKYKYECITIDSGSEEASFLADLFGLDADFLIEEFVPANVRSTEHDHLLDFIEQVIKAWMAGRIEIFATENATMPTTVQLAQKAQRKFLEIHDITTIDPFRISNPGDALREISRTIEWDLFREYQRRERSVELIRIVLGNNPVKMDAADIIRRLIDELPRIDALMLSASQQRKSRAGYSYEHHIETMLSGGSIPFEKQVIIEARKRPDFILPSLAFIDGKTEHASTGLILSAKTTLRERWKQVEREKGARTLYLTTVDENIAGNAIEDMASIGVHLVIPESLKYTGQNRTNKTTEYAGHSNVLTFREFCDEVLSPNLPYWT